MPEISVIVPVYNAENYLDKCIESILNQTFTDFECILVDDGSPDNCPQICDEYAKQDRRVKVIHKENGGVSSARNVGLDAAEGKYISFVDSDDQIQIQTLELLMMAAIEYQSDAVTINSKKDSSILNKEYKYKEVSRNLYNINDIRSNLYKFVYSYEYKDIISCGLFGIYKCDCFKGVRFDENIYAGEDIDVIIRLNLRIRTIIHLDASCYYYCTEGQSITRSNFNTKKITYLLFLEKAYKMLKDVHISDYQKFQYVYIHDFFGFLLDCKASNNAEINREMQKYKAVFRRESFNLIKNKYLRFVERIIILLYVFNIKLYEKIFGKYDESMKKVIETFTND